MEGYSHYLYVDSLFTHKVIGIFVFLLLVVVGLSNYTILAQTSSRNISSQIPGNLQEEEFVLYENSTYGITFESPFNWSKAEILMGNFVDIKFIDPAGFSPIGAPPTLDINIERNLQNVSNLADYARVSYQMLNNIFGNVSLLASQESRIGGSSPAIERVFTFDQFGVGYQGAAIFTIRDNNAYLISLITQADTFQRYFPVFRHVADSFQVTNRTLG